MTATETPGGNVLAASNRGDAREVPDVPARITTWTIRIDAPRAWITANHRMNRWKLADAVRDWRTAGFYAAHNTRPKLPTGLQLARVDILLRWAKPPVRDVENARETVKAAVDGALGPRRGGLGYGVVVDDSDKHLIYGSYESELIVVRPSVLVLKPFVGQIVMTVTDLSGGDPG